MTVEAMESPIDRGLRWYDDSDVLPELVVRPAVDDAKLLAIYGHATNARHLEYEVQSSTVCENDYDAAESSSSRRACQRCACGRDCVPSVFSRQSDARRGPDLQRPRRRSRGPKTGAKVRLSIGVGRGVGGIVAITARRDLNSTRVSPAGTFREYTAGGLSLVLTGGLAYRWN